MKTVLINIWKNLYNNNYYIYVTTDDLDFNICKNILTELNNFIILNFSNIKTELVIDDSNNEYLTKDLNYETFIRNDFKIKIKNLDIKLINEIKELINNSNLVVNNYKLYIINI